MGSAGRKPLVIADYDPAWPDRFLAIGRSLRGALGDAILCIDHIGSTAVAGLPAKDLIDVQVTVRDLAGADAWAEELLPGLVRRQKVTADHVPPGATADPSEWTKRYWSERWTLHVHVREQGRLNQRYPAPIPRLLARRLGGGRGLRTGQASARRRGARRLGYLLRREGPCLRCDHRGRGTLGTSGRLDALGQRRVAVDVALSEVGAVYGGSRGALHERANATGSGVDPCAAGHVRAGAALLS